MTEAAHQLELPGLERELAEWRRDYQAQIGAGKTLRNRSGLEVKALYTSDDWSDGVATITLSDEMVPADRDFELIWTPKAGTARL